MEYLHTMIRVTDLDQSLDFFCNKLGLARSAARATRKAAIPWSFCWSGDAERRTRSTRRSSS